MAKRGAHVPRVTTERGGEETRGEGKKTNPLGSMGENGEGMRESGCMISCSGGTW